MSYNAAVALDSVFSQTEKKRFGLNGVNKIDNSSKDKSPKVDKESV